MGQTAQHLKKLDRIWIHRDVLEPFVSLQEAAAQEGFDLQGTSAFRSYEQQLSIWNEKALGERPLLDGQGTPLDWSALSLEECLTSILRWSAVPGASRHHWGTDVDVYDRNALWEVELTPSEVDGPMAPFHRWLDENLGDFFRPYDRDRGGVSPEKWHISYRPLSMEYFHLYDFSLFEQVISNPKLQLGDLLREKGEWVFSNYVQNIDRSTV